MAGLEVSSKIHICFKCGKAYGRKKGTFYVSHSALNKGSGNFPYCIKCMETIYIEYFNEIGNAKDAVRQVCRKFDIYWSPTVLERVEMKSAARSLLSGYISSINAVKYVGKSYDDTLREESIFWATDVEMANISNISEDEEEVADEEDALANIPPEIIAFWGNGFDADFYVELNQRYKSWIDDDTTLEPGERAIYKQICILEATINKDTAAGKSIDKHVNSLNSLLGSANVKPQQKKKDEAGAGFDTTPFGVWIRRWEDEHPIPEPEDENKIIKLVNTWFFGHIGKLFGIKNVHSTLYEEAIKKYKVEMPEFEDDDDDTIIANLFGGDTS